MSHGRSQRRKAVLGQHFLVNTGVARDIVAALGDVRASAVIEVGPGKGALTRPLLEACARVVAVEIDPALADDLELEMPPGPASGRGELALVRGDATRIPWRELLALASAGGIESSVPLAANLPYESGTAILLDWMAASAADTRLDRAVVMLQLEVAQRLVAKPRSEAYGSLGALAACTHRVKPLMKVGPGSFRPQPKVWSQVVALVARPDPLFSPEERTRHAPFIQAAFAHRRKQLAVAMNGRDGLDRDAWRDQLEAQGLPATSRAEEMSPEGLVALSRAASTAAARRIGA